MVLLMRLIRKVNIQKYWSTDPLLTTPIFSQVMPSDSFQAILCNLHFFDTLSLVQRGNTDKLQRIHLVLDSKKHLFSSSFIPLQELGDRRELGFVARTHQLPAVH